MLLRYYEPEISLPPCDPNSETVNVVARLSDDISPVFPYLNAVLKNCIYNHEAQLITIREKGRMITMRPREIAISGLRSTDERRGGGGSGALEGDHQQGVGGARENKAQL